MTRNWLLSGLFAIAAALPLNAQEVLDGVEAADDADAVPAAPALEIEVVEEEVDEPPVAPAVEVAPAIPVAEPVEEPPVRVEVEPEPKPAAIIVDETIDVTPRPALGVRFFRGDQVRIAHVVDASPADRVGLMVDDVVVSYNGEFPGSTDHFISLVAAAPLDAASEIVIVRGGERRAITIQPAAWGNVFAEPYRTARPEFDVDVDVDNDGDADVYPHPHAHYHAPYRWYSPYYATNVSPVVVPASWYVPYPYPYPYYYTAAWGYWPGWYYYNAYAPAYYYWPYYAYAYGPYYGYWNYPAYWPGYYGPHHHPHHDHNDDDHREQDSARVIDDSVVIRAASH